MSGYLHSVGRSPKPLYYTVTVHGGGQKPLYYTVTVRKEVGNLFTVGTVEGWGQKPLCCKVIEISK